jgi:hypothetical protein
MCHDMKVLKTPPGRDGLVQFLREVFHCGRWKVEAGLESQGQESLHIGMLNVESFINGRSQTIKEVLLWSVMVDKHVGFILCATSKPVFLIVEDYTASSKQVKGVKCLSHEETFYTNTYGTYKESIR